MASLTDKQRAFALEYTQSLNATDAARRAGYQGTYESLRVIGSQNLTKTHVRAAIDKLLEERALRANEVISRLTDQALGVPGDCIVVQRGEDGKVWAGVDFERLKERNLLHLIKKIKYDKNGEPEVEFYDSQSALSLLGKYHSLFTDKVKVEDWRSEAIEYIRRGELSFEALVEEGFDRDLATELFKAAGIPVQTGKSSAGR
ncbi:MAG: terminase small subunit [Candidatus Paceibacterota bacterium]|jgi:hypothetical protein